MTLPVRLLRLPRSRLQTALFTLAGTFLLTFAVALTLSPAARAHSWAVSYRWQHWLGVAIWFAGFALAGRAVSRRTPQRDPLLLPLVALLTGWGLLTIFRLSVTFGLRQSLWLALCSAVFIYGLARPALLDILRRYKYVWLVSGLLLTALTLILGTNPLGAGPRLWLGCCGVYLQPSEPLKLLLIVYLASYLADRQPLTPNIVPLLIPTLTITGIALLLLVIQRDLGTAAIFVFIYSAVVFVATGKKRILLISLLTIAGAGLLGALLFDVVALRVEAWFNPWLDPSGRSYQIVQSLLAVASGGLLGRGPGMGSPTVVPVAHSDFVFAAIAEEFGLLGTLPFLLLIGLLAMRGLRISLGAENRYHRYLAVGISAYFACQTILIIGGNIRLLPLTGVTLPFVSYGGSSLLTSFLGILLLAHIANTADAQQIDSATAGAFHLLAGILLAGLAAAAITSGWWAYWRGPELLTRTDNIRRAIAARYVPRGDILDRDGIPLQITTGVAEDYQRAALLPDAGAVLGFSHPVYGQAGIEAAFDSILRGLANYPALTIWRYHLLYGQPPPGLDIRLTLTHSLQLAAQAALDDEPGAIVILNPATGEILALASSPSFNGDEIGAQAEQLSLNPDSPLFNRSTQGLYQPGPTLGPLLYAAAVQQGLSIPEPAVLEFQLNEDTFTCSRTPLGIITWGNVLQGGCPGPLAELGLLLGGERLLVFFQELGLYSAPAISLPTASLTKPALISAPGSAASGQGSLRVSPLQLALALASLSNHGQVPAAQLLLEIQNPAGGWEARPPGAQPARVLESHATQAALEFIRTDQNSWELSARALNGPESPLAWYVTGSQPDADVPVLVLVLLEGDQPALARAIGRALWLQAVATP